MTDFKLLQQALDALEFPHDSEWSNKAKTIEALQHALAQPEQEPMRWFQQFGDAPSKPWVGLTLNDITGCMCDCADDDGTYKTSCFIDYAKAIEQKLKDLNT